MANVSSSNGLEKRPKLRFPGFDEPYKQCRIGDIYAERSQRGATDMELLSVTMNDGVKPRSEIEGKDNSSEDKSNYKIVRKGDMVYNSMRMWQGANGISPCDGIVSPAYTVLMPKQEINNGYFAALFKSANLINEFRKNSQGMTSDTWNLKYPQIETIKIQIPSVSEQDKVSELFGVLDARIVAQAQLVESLKKYKRGVSDYLFLQNSKMPIHCKWKQFSFGEVVEINPKTPPLPEQFIYIDLECVESGQLKSLNYINKNHAPSRAQRVLCRNDVLFQMVRPYQKNNYLYRDIFDVPVVASTGYAQIRCSECNPFFVYEQISSEQFSREAMMRSTGTGYPAINTDGLAQIPFYVPTPEEQEKIGVFLSALGAKIAKESEILAALDILKKALMQQLFT